MRNGRVVASPPYPIAVIGIGDDGAGGLSADAQALIATADLLAGGYRHLEWFPDHAARKVPITKQLNELCKQLEIAQARGERSVVLASGDPLFFGIGAYLSRHFGRHRVYVLPHLSSIQLAFARLAIPWDDAIILSAHGRPLVPLIRSALEHEKVAFLTDDTNTPAAIATALLTAGMEDCDVAVCDHLGGPGERIVETTLSRLSALRFTSLNVLLLLRSTPRFPTLTYGLSEESYAHLRGQITKAEVRAVSLAKLRLTRRGVLWDIGAGSGSLSIEAAQLSAGRVYAIERAGEQQVLLQQNIASHYAGNVTLVPGEAPEALANLPTPDAVFIGGSGGRLAAILQEVNARLPESGHLVLNLTLLEHLTESMTMLESWPYWQTEIVQLQIARSAPLAGRLRFTALNPVWILSASKRGPQ
ncbi:MAG: precorrin-6y C5,15-methyltransferase (decarboxylating) subunit CbiE [Chloroflexi bacterium]|nr:precorrin-6y C5,15-methyltransferase (decarboxylating) subunit CbiE [Chloroflexota bacterium]